jgi:hypothetical protein
MSTKNVEVKQIGGGNGVSTSQKLFILLRTMDTKLDHLTTQCNERFVRLEQKVDDLETKVTSEIQKSISALGVNFVNNPGNGGGMGGSMTAMSMAMDKKEDYLNMHVKNVPQVPLKDFIGNACQKYMKHSHVYEIMNNKYTLFDYICNVVDFAQEDSGLRCYFAFPFQRNTVYMWNHDKCTWEVAMISDLKHLFDIVQRHMVLCYNNLIETLQENGTFHMKSIEFMEKGEAIFCDNFDKKYKTFKKQMYDKLVNN